VTDVVFSAALIIVTIAILEWRESRLSRIVRAPQTRDERVPHRERLGAARPSARQKRAA